IIRCAVKRGKILRLSQVPYFPSGRLSLFQQIIFPAVGIAADQETNNNGEDFSVDDALISGILNNLQLSWIIERCGGLYSPVEFEWQDTLTPGEQQRLAFARVIYQRPELVILDESTSSVGVDVEERMYQLLTEVIFHCKNAKTICLRSPNS
ncbi:unnamed protein product, partial [Gongylonema pulchrum]|uniref:ABC transporter domain-containing protein n=1 Tax=Gongylonema pulchrum TaxID=637853 RepID=A0A183D6I1_9BILA